MKLIHRLLALSLLTSPLAAAPVADKTTASSVSQAQPRNIQVVGWVPPYGIETSIAALSSNPLIGKGLTRIGLQFWNPSKDGKSLVLAPVDDTGKQVDPRHIDEIRDWAHARNIKVLLTVYNNSQVLKHWDWPLARNAFANNRKAFAAALVAEMDRYKLDGIDLDLEGEGFLDDDRPVYARFVKHLSKLVRPRGKLLTIDTFHSPCFNAPNMLWWQDWAGHIDALHSMGYQDLYEGSTDTFTPPGKTEVCAGGAPLFRYSWQQQYGIRAGYKPEQIILGAPTWMDDWGKAGATGKGSSIVAHMEELRTLGAGVALWDLQLSTPGWRSDATWQAVEALRKP
ncbi:glycosyl hydrolase family 18 protein [Chitinimonas sp. BJYL2]|uniref:glycosyl hydrolase family 18 protein n=1 Tax=Chitinimonas sp. BJYL2 TaxID=2976696 RepID=UPI0022B4765E|nr:glycosyl hydrolase family 18 protein [Chitinimonas sp. BJYL2]